MGEIMLTGQPPTALLGAIHAIRQSGGRLSAPAYFDENTASGLFGNQINFSPAAAIIACADVQSLCHQKQGSPIFSPLSFVHD